MDFPNITEYNSFYATYINHLPKRDPIQLLEETKAYGEYILSKVSKEQSTYAYATGKWTIKALLLHVIDTEQIMAYRALRFARNDLASTLLFDENVYALHSRAEQVEWNNLKTHFEALRTTSIQQFLSYDSVQESRGGSEIFPNSVRAIACIIAGHQLHHFYVLQQRYLKEEPVLLETFLATRV